MKTPCPASLRAGYRLKVFIVGAALWTITTAAQALLATCTVSTTPLVFGVYQPVTFAGKISSADKTSMAAITVDCSGLLQLGSYTLSLGAGNYGPGDRISTRYMNNSTQSSDNMAFNVYTDATYATVWGNGVIGSLINGSAPLILGQNSQTHTAYGKIPAGQSNMKAGNYADTLNITLTYNP